MSDKIKQLESSRIIIDHDHASISIDETLDQKRFNVKINDNYDRLSLGIPYPDDNTIYYVPYKDIIKVLQRHFCEVKGD